MPSRPSTSVPARTVPPTRRRQKRKILEFCEPRALLEVVLCHQLLTFTVASLTDAVVDTLQSTSPLSDDLESLVVSKHDELYEVVQVCVEAMVEEEILLSLAGGRYRLRHAHVAKNTVPSKVSASE